MYFITTEHWLCRNFCKTKQSDVFYIDIVSNSTVSLLNGSVYVIGVTIYRKDSHHDHVAVELHGVVHVSPCLHVCKYARVHVCTKTRVHVCTCSLVHMFTCARVHENSCARMHVCTCEHYVQDTAKSAQHHPPQPPPLYRSQGKYQD